MLYCTMPLYYAFVLCTLKTKHKKESCTMLNYKNIMAQKNHVVLCRITKYELTLYYVGRNVLFFLFKSINGLIFFFHSCAVFTIVLMIFPGIGPVIYVLLCLRVQNRRKKWNFPLNFHTMRKLSDLYSGIFQNY